MWKKGTGEEESATEVPPGSFATAPSTVHSAFALEDVRIPGSGEHLDCATARIKSREFTEFSELNIPSSP